MRIVHLEPASFLPCPVRLIGRRLPAGFPSPADDYLEDELDLQRYLIDHPAATYAGATDGHSMVGAGILSGDKLIIDRSLTARPGDIVVAIIHGEMTVKRLTRRANGGFELRAEPCPSDQTVYPVFVIDEAHPFEIWGVVCGMARRYERR